MAHLIGQREPQLSPVSMAGMSTVRETGRLIKVVRRLLRASDQRSRKQRMIAFSYVGIPLPVVRYFRTRGRDQGWVVEVDESNMIVVVLGE